MHRSILVLGSTGMLGSALVRWLGKSGHTVTSLSRAQFDVLRDPIRDLDLTGMDYVVNAIGLINRRIALDTASFYLVNSLFPRLLADHCARHAVRLIHISTDCVFDGSHGPYTEDASTTATDIYGHSKAWGEPGNCMVLRTSIIGPEQANYYSLLNWFLAQSTTCRGYCNHLWNGMTTLELSRVIDQIVQKELYENCLHHVFSRDTTKYELLQLIRTAYQHPVEIIPWEDTVARDTRLRTAHADFFAQLEIIDLDDQIAELPRYSDAKGHWSS